VAETDSFIDEVSEEVRRDRLFGFFRKWGWLIALVLILIVGAAAFNEWRKAQAESSRQDAGDALIAALSAEDPGAQAAALGTLAPDVAEQAMLAELGRAAALLSDGREDDAVSVLRDSSGRTDVPIIYTDLAKLKAAMLNPEGTEARAILDEIAGGGRPFRLLALELRAQQALRDDDTETALADLISILEDPGTTRELRVRAEYLVTVLGGEIPARASTLPTLQ